jgi:hypothetical protein
MWTVWPSSSNCCRALVIVTACGRQQIRYQVIVFNELTLLIARVLGDHALATETHPLHEFVDGLAFIGGSLDYLPQFEA